MNDSVIIKDVVLARPTGHLESGYTKNNTGVVGKMMIEFENIKTETCVIDEIRGKAISIETADIYDIVRRDMSGRIIPDEIGRVQQNNIIALKLIDKDWDKISMLYKMNLKRRAKQVFESYLTVVSEEENGKVYTRDGNN